MSENLVGAMRMGPHCHTGPACHSRGNASQVEVPTLTAIWWL